LARWQQQLSGSVSVNDGQYWIFDGQYWIVGFISVNDAENVEFGGGEKKLLVEREEKVEEISK
jgi:hypothetical protein